MNELWEHCVNWNKLEAGGGQQEMDKSGQIAQISTYKMNKFWGSNVQHGNYN